MNPQEFASIAVQLAGSVPLPPTITAHVQMAQWLGIVEALAQGRLTFAAPEVRDAEQAA